MFRKIMLFTSMAMVATAISWKSADFSTISIASAGEHKYIGRDNCRECHTKLYKSYEAYVRRGQEVPRKLPNSYAVLSDLSSVEKYFKESKKHPGESKYKTKEKHRVNLSKLKLDFSKDYSQDEKCLTCHTTGYKHGGFDPAKPNPNLAGVTCEACHGPGSDYVPYMEKAAEKYQKAEALKFGMYDIQADEGKKNCVNACHKAKSDCPVVSAIDDYKFDWKKRHHKTHDSKTGKWKK